MAIFIQNREELEQRLVIMNTQEGWSIRALARHFADQSQHGAAHPEKSRSSAGSGA